MKTWDQHPPFSLRGAAGSWQLVLLLVCTLRCLQHCVPAASVLRQVPSTFLRRQDQLLLLTRMSRL